MVAVADNIRKSVLRISVLQGCTVPVAEPVALPAYNIVPLANMRYNLDRCVALSTRIHPKP